MSKELCTMGVRGCANGVELEDVKDGGPQRVRYVTNRR